MLICVTSLEDPYSRAIFVEINIKVDTWKIIIESYSLNYKQFRIFKFDAISFFALDEIGTWECGDDARQMQVHSIMSRFVVKTSITYNLINK